MYRGIYFQQKLLNERNYNKKKIKAKPKMMIFVVLYCNVIKIKTYPKKRNSDIKRI